MTKDKLIVALDVAKEIQAKELVSQLRNEVGGFKVGLQLFTAIGGSFVREMAKNQIKIFLDLKLHDIPNTVAKAAVEAARLGIWMFNLHILCGSETLLRTVDEIREVCEKERLIPPKVLGVTVLTSSTDETLREVGIEVKTTDQVLRLARLASRCGLDGVVASPQEIKMIRGEIENKRFLIVTPGIRSNEKSRNLKIDVLDDQKRTMSAGEALAAGANYIVVGRPIIQSKNMIAAVKELITDMEKPREENPDFKLLDFSDKKAK